MTNKQIERFTELGDKAREVYIENSDFNPEDWLDKNEVDEYINLRDLFLTDKPYAKQ